MAESESVARKCGVETAKASGGDTSDSETASCGYCSSNRRHRHHRTSSGAKDRLQAPSRMQRARESTSNEKHKRRRQRQHVSLRGRDTVSGVTHACLCHGSGHSTRLCRAIYRRRRRASRCTSLRRGRRASARWSGTAQATSCLASVANCHRARRRRRRLEVATNRGRRRRLAAWRVLHSGADPANLL